MSRVIGVSHEQLKDFPDHEVWERVGYYLAQLAVNVFLMTSVEKIVIGGGLSHSPKLFGFVKMHFDRLINGYVKIPQHEQAYSHPILCEPALDDLNGLLGAVIAFGLN